MLNVNTDMPLMQCTFENRCHQQIMVSTQQFQKNQTVQKKSKHEHKEKYLSKY